MSGIDIAGQPGVGWDETQCIKALAQLEQVQLQIDDLRLAIPRILEPFHQPLTPSTFKAYAQSAMSSQYGIKALGEQWKTLESQNTFEYAKKSYSDNADLSASVSIPSHGWRERERNKTASKMNGNGGNMEGIRTATREEDVSGILAEFRIKYPDVLVETPDDHRNISIKFRSRPVKLLFHIGIERDETVKHKLTAECVGNTEFCQAITRCMASRPRTNDLGYLLEMIAAYKVVEPTTCAKCAKLVDNAMLLSTARRSKQTEDTDGALKTVWEAFHECCIE